MTTTRDIDQAIEVLHQDEFLAVVNKPARLMMHDSALARGEQDFLADRLRTQFGRRIYLAHRLDRATSGCVALSFDENTAHAMMQLFANNQVQKHYLAVCRGWPAENEFSIDHPLDGGPGKPDKKPAITHLEVLNRAELPLPANGFPTSRYALLRCRLETGRYRQIRRHLHHVHHHLIGDTSHGDGRRNRDFRMHGIHRMMLHAATLAFPHPRTGEALEFHAPGDAEWQKAMQWLGFNPC